MIRYDTGVCKALCEHLATKNGQRAQDTLGRAIGRAWVALGRWRVVQSSLSPCTRHRLVHKRHTDHSARAIHARTAVVPVRSLHRATTPLLVSLPSPPRSTRIVVFRVRLLQSHFSEKTKWNIYSRQRLNHYARRCRDASTPRFGFRGSPPQSSCLTSFFFVDEREMRRPRATTGFA